MVLPTTGTIYMSQLKTEFGGLSGSATINLSDYYYNSSTKYTYTVSGVPNIGNTLYLANSFYGKAITSNYSNLVLFLDATNSNSYTGSGAVNWIDLSTSVNTVALTNCEYSNVNNGVVRFNGASSYAYKATFANMNSGNFTCISWINVAGNYLVTTVGGTQAGGIIFTLNRTSTNTYNELVYYINYIFDWNSAYGFNTAPSTKILSSNWYQIAFVKNGTSGKFYLNGNINSATTAALNVSYGTNNFCIGKDYRDNNTYLLGNISKIMIYNYSLTDAEITSNFNNYRGLYGI